MTRTTRWAAALCLLLAGLAPGARAHLPDEYDSVHFNSGQPDFGELPRRVVLWHEQDVRSSGGWDMSEDQNNLLKQELTPEGDDNRDLAAEHRDTAGRKQARDAEAIGDWTAARHAYERIAAANRWTGDLRDRVCVLDVAEQQKVGVGGRAGIALRDYLHAMDEVEASFGEKWGAAKTVFAAIVEGREGGTDAEFLRPFARYQIASLYAAWFDYTRAVAEYQSLLRDYPNFARCEDALIMIGRAAILPTQPRGRNVAAGSAAIRTLLAEFPHSRFRNAAVGLRARIDLAEGRPESALETYFAIDDLASVEATLKELPPKEQQAARPRLLCAYLRRLDRANTYLRCAGALANIRSTIDQLDPGGAREFVRRLRAEPDLAPPYFYYRLYHCDNKERDYDNLAQLATTLGEQTKGRISAHIAIRFAEAFYSDGDDDEALHWARIAAARNGGSEPYDRALYLEGAVWNRTEGQAADARRAFETLLRRCPDSHLRFEARENLAIADERCGDLFAALDQYFVLDYKPDIAYFLDVRLTIPQVAAYAARRPTAVVGRDRHELLVYSLGMRAMREERWPEARHCFESMPHRRFANLWKARDADNPANADDDGRWGYDAAQPDPLYSIAALSRLQHAAQSAVGGDARAHALFAYAGYYYGHGNLLLYNASLWEGDREKSFDFNWNGKIATPADGVAIRRHMYEHEVYARTEAICARIARDYPDTPTAPYALYRAACCARKLARFNGWWESDNRVNDHYQRAANLMAQLARRYPRSPLHADARKFARVFQEDADRDREYRSSNTDDDNHKSYRYEGDGGDEDKE